jgi:hypothetical protein
MTRFVTSLRRAFVQATTLDPAATRMLEQNYVAVKMNSRLWGN